jgi:hypothetical protein
VAVSYRVVLQDQQTGALVHCRERFREHGEALAHGRRMFTAWAPFVRKFDVRTSTLPPTHTYWGRFRRIR